MVMNTGFDFEAGKLWREEDGGEKKKDNLQPLHISCCKTGETLACLLHLARICLLNVRLRSEFSTEPESPGVGGIVRS